MTRVDEEPQCVILAGGLSTRMHPRTRDVPKLLLPVRGRPFAAWLLERLSSSGFRDVVLCIGHLGAMIREAVGEGGQYGVRVRYSDEGALRLGTAGALRHAVDLLNPSFLVTYGDSYLPFDYGAPLADLRAHEESLATMAVYPNSDRFEPSNVEIRGGLVVRYQKRRTSDPPDPALDHIDYGAMALRREVILALPRGEAVGLDAVQAGLAGGGRMRALVVNERFYEIGSEAGLAALDAALSRSQ